MCFGRGRAFFLFSSAGKSPSSAEWPLSLLCRVTGSWIGVGCPLLSAHPSIAPGIVLNSEMWKLKLKQYYLLFPFLIHHNVYFCLMYFGFFYIFLILTFNVFFIFLNIFRTKFLSDFSIKTAKIGFGDITFSNIVSQSSHKFKSFNFLVKIKNFFFPLMPIFL